MKITPINGHDVLVVCLNSEDCRKILDGRKTQIRRILKIQPENYPARAVRYTAKKEWIWESHSGKTGIFRPYKFKCPYEIGDYLLIREPWVTYVDQKPTGVLYKADHPALQVEWKQSTHMPAKYARPVYLEVRDVRVERIRAISEADVIAEGFTHLASQSKGQWNVNSFEAYWAQQHGNHAWARNDWVFVYDVKLIKQEDL